MTRLWLIAALLVAFGALAGCQTTEEQQTAVPDTATPPTGKYKILKVGDYCDLRGTEVADR
jgi:hypothetical protein